MPFIHIGFDRPPTQQSKVRWIRSPSLPPASQPVEETVDEDVIHTIHRPYIIIIFKYSYFIIKRVKDFARMP
jgi:hypothetical protein